MLDKYTIQKQMEIEIESYPVADLPSRYQIGKQQVYNRFVALAIKPSKVGKRAYITNAQLQLLDRFHAHLIDGGLMADFDLPTTQPDAKISPVDAIDITSGIVENNLEALVNMIAGAVSQVIDSTIPTRSPLWYMSELEQAQAQGWMLTTAEIQQLIGVKPTAAIGTSTYQRGSFTFTKAGKIGSQTAWRVTKNLD